MSRCIVLEDSAHLQVDLRLVNPLNRREHWAARAKRTRREREIITRLLGRLPDSLTRPGVITVTMIRVSPRLLDDDGLAAAFKAVRDAIAKALGRDDDPKSGVRWAVHQTQGKPKQHSVHVIIRRAE